MELSDLTEKIIGCAFRVYNIMGSGFLESVYHKSLHIELEKSGLASEVHKPIKVYYDKQPVGDFIADIIVNNSVVVELKAIQNLNKALSESQIQKKAALQIDKQKATLDVKLKALNSDKIQQNEVLKQQVAEQAKVNKQLAREELKLVTVYEKEAATLNKLRKKLKDLVLTEGESSKKTKDLAKQVGKLDAKLKKADAAAGQFQRNVGNYPKALKGAIGSLKNFAGALGLVGGVQLLTRTITSSFNTIKAA